MNYLQKKKLAFMSIVNSVKGFVRNITGVFPLTLTNCVDEESITDYTIYGNSVQNGTPKPDNPIEVECVGELVENLFNEYDELVLGYYDDSGAFKSDNSVFKTAQYIPVKPDTFYTVKGKSLVQNEIGYMRIAEFNSEKTFIKRSLSQKLSEPAVTIETTSATAFVAISYDYGESSDDNVAQIVDIHLCEGINPNNCGKYKIPIKVSGKNLLVLSRDNQRFTQNGVTFAINKDKGITMNGTCTADVPIDVSKDNGFTAGGGTYTLCGCFGGSTSTYYLQTQNGFTDTGRGVTVSTKEDKNIVRLYVKKGTVLDNVTICPMLIKGNYVGKVPDYEPYHEPITTNIYLDEPLRKVGDYADYIDFENGKIVRNVKTVALQKADAQYSWISKKGVAFKNVLSENLNRAKGLCNRENLFTADGGETTTMWVGVESKWVYWIGILDYLGMTTIDEFNEWLANNPTYVYYGTHNPTETLITLPNIPTFRGTSILNADTTIQPSNAEVTYYSIVKE